MKAQPYEGVIGCCDDCGAEDVTIYRSEAGWTRVSCVLEEEDGGYTELHLDVALGVLAAEAERARQAEAEIAVLKEILTDPMNQLEQTSGHYTYRFDLETMHRIADAIGLPKAGDVLASYTPQELTKLIR